MPAVVQFQNVVYAVGGRTILHSFNLDVHAGETVVLLGRSGTGKTTALKLINALLYPTSGEVVVDGKSTREWDPVELRRHTGYVIQDVGLFPHWTVARNIGLVPVLNGEDTGTIDTRVHTLMRQVGLQPDEFAARKPSQLSGGQKQRVGVARALAANPRVLLFDEPFGAVDPVTRVQLQKLFVQLHSAREQAAIFVTHDVREAMIVGTRIALLRAGEIEWIGKAADFPSASGEEAEAFLACLQ